MKDIMGIQGFAALLFEINTKFTRTNAVVGFPVAVKAPKFLVRVFQLFVRERAHHFDQNHLGSCIELIELVHALFAEIDLKHGIG